MPAALQLPHQQQQILDWLAHGGFVTVNRATGQVYADEKPMGPLRALMNLDREHLVEMEERTERWYATEEGYNLGRANAIPSRQP